MSNENSNLVILKAAETAKAIAVIRTLFACIMSLVAFINGVALFWMWIRDPRWELLVFSLVWVVLTGMIFVSRNSGNPKEIHDEKS